MPCKKHRGRQARLVKEPASTAEEPAEPGTLPTSAIVEPIANRIAALTREEFKAVSEWWQWAQAEVQFCKDFVDHIWNLRRLREDAIEKLSVLLGSAIMDWPWVGLR